MYSLTYLFICLFLHRFTYWFSFSSISLICLFVYLLIYLPIYDNYSSIYISSYVHLLVLIFIYLFIYLLVYWSIYLPVHPPLMFLRRPSNPPPLFATGERWAATTVRWGIAPHVPPWRDLHPLLRVHDAHDRPFRHHTPPVEELARFRGWFIVGFVSLIRGKKVSLSLWKKN